MRREARLGRGRRRPHPLDRVPAHTRAEGRPGPRDRRLLEVRSVLLVSDVSREKIGSVALDPASRTSAALTRILLKRVYGVSPEYREGDASADARLIIGDPALKTRLNGHVVLDLAAEWRAFSGHPFVFAFWAVRESAASPEVAAILRSSYAAGVHQFDRLVREESVSSGLSEAVVEDYLATLSTSSSTRATSRVWLSTIVSPPRTD